VIKESYYYYYYYYYLGVGVAARSRVVVVPREDDHLRYVRHVGAARVIGHLPEHARRVGLARRRCRSGGGAVRTPSRHVPRLESRESYAGELAAAGRSLPRRRHGLALLVQLVHGHRLTAGVRLVLVRVERHVAGRRRRRSQTARRQLVQSSR